jgi:hypothetical protein
MDLQVSACKFLGAGNSSTIQRDVWDANLFILEVVKARIDPAQKNPKTIHHHGYGRFVVDGEMIKLKSKMP